MKGGNIDAIADLVFKDVPMTSPYNKQGKHDGWKDNKLHVLYPTKKTSDTQINTISERERENMPFSITGGWTKYINIDTSLIGTNSEITISFKILIPTINPNNPNKRGQTLLYLAAQNCNQLMFDALVAMDADPMVLNKHINISDIGQLDLPAILKQPDSGSILHGIAWGKVDEQGKSTKTYDEKVAFIQYILGRYPDTILLLFHKNLQGETFYDNLLMRHPDKMSLSLFPLKWVRYRDSSKPEGDVNEYYFYNSDIPNSSRYKHPSNN
jgi:hypothetical protein